MSFKPIDPKRDEIRRYLERGSVLDSLTKIFVRVIKERPEDPMEYIRNNIGVVRHQHDKYERLQEDLQRANEEISRLRAIIKSINPDVLEGQSQFHVEDPDTAEVAVISSEEANKRNDEISTSSLNNVEAAAAIDNADNQLSSDMANCQIDPIQTDVQNTPSNQNEGVIKSVEVDSVGNAE